MDHLMKKTKYFAVIVDADNKFDSIIYDENQSGLVKQLLLLKARVPGVQIVGIFHGWDCDFEETIVIK